jgi:hypothetical protein
MVLAVDRDDPASGPADLPRYARDREHMIDRLADLLKGFPAEPGT